MITDSFVSMLSLTQGLKPAFIFFFVSKVLLKHSDTYCHLSSTAAMTIFLLGCKEKLFNSTS